MSHAGLGLAGLAAGAGAGFYAGRSRLASDIALMVSPSPNVEGIIDTHHHFLPDFYYDSIGRDFAAALTPTHQPPKWSQEGDLAVMDDYRIRKAVVSAPLGVRQDTPEKVVALATRLNEFSAGMVHARPDRYAHFAILPLPDIDASLNEAAKALDTLSAAGVVISTNYQGVYLGDAKFEPLWQEMNQRKAAVFVHPVSPDYQISGIPPGVLEFVFDTTRTVTSLVYAGVTIRYPDIRFIFSHDGGTVPFIASRIAGGVRMDPVLANTLPEGVMPELRKLHWDTALGFSDTAMPSLLAMADPSKIMFGTDVPFAPNLVIPLGLKSLNKEVQAVELSSILHGSALRAMPCLA